MKEHPILFSAAMVQAILRVDKTQTRRPIKPQPQSSAPGVYADRYNHGPEWAFWLPDNRMTQPRVWKCPYGVPGDRLWVREAWTFFDPTETEPDRWDGPVVAPDNSDERRLLDYWRKRIIYRADGEPDVVNPVPRWRPSIHLPSWASRITLEVTEVRVQRVQGISEEDAKAEGALAWHDADESRPFRNTAREAFHELWNSINAKRGFGWAVNPWVWAITFRRIEAKP